MNREIREELITYQRGTSARDGTTEQARLQILQLLPFWNVPIEDLGSNTSIDNAKATWKQPPSTARHQQFGEGHIDNESEDVPRGKAHIEAEENVGDNSEINTKESNNENEKEDEDNDINFTNEEGSSRVTKNSSSKNKFRWSKIPGGVTHPVPAKQCSKCGTYFSANDSGTRKLTRHKVDQRLRQN